MQQTFLLPNGYRICERKKEMDIETAVEILSTRRQKRYTGATRLNHGPTAELVRHTLVCPHCEHEIPAYASFLTPLFAPHFWRPSDRISKRIIAEWGSAQITFFEPEYTTLAFNDVCRPRRVFHCPKCSNTSKPCTSLRHTTISADQHRIQITCEVLGLEELLSLPWFSSEEILLRFPIYETCTFNLRNGHTYVQLGDQEGTQIFAIRDVTYCPELMIRGSVYWAITSNKTVRRTLKQLFEKLFGGALPFSKEELEPEKFILMTRFIGYDRAFYDVIPYKYDSCKVEGSFKKIAWNLHTKERAIRYFERSALPKIKSVRRLYFGNPGFLFYLQEGEQLWEILQDASLFCRLMRSKEIYELLSLLHQRPGITDFFRDYCREKGAPLLVKRLITECLSTMRYAINYCSMSKRMKELEMHSWKNKQPLSRIGNLEPSFSRPLCQPDEEIKDCTIDGFRFFWLRTKKDYRLAGKSMRNCLSEWSGQSNPVVAVKKGDRWIGAIEVRKQHILQAYGCSNTSLKDIPDFTEAYDKWKQKYRLTEEDDADLEFDDDFDLPF